METDTRRPGTARRLLRRHWLAAVTALWWVQAVRAVQVTLDDANDLLSSWYMVGWTLWALLWTVLLALQAHDRRRRRTGLRPGSTRASHEVRAARPAPRRPAA